MRNFVVLFLVAVQTFFCLIVEARTPPVPLAHLCLSAAPDTLFFGVMLAVGEDSTQCVKVTNCGDTAVFFAADIPGVGYELSDAFTPQLQPDSSFTFCIKFQPQSFGVPATFLNVSIPGTGKSVSVPLLGRTTCSILLAVPDSAVFPVTPLGNNDTTISIQIRNSGNLAWSPDLPIISPANGTFNMISFDTSAIPPGGSKMLKVQYSPTAAGKDSATITFPYAGPCGNLPPIYLRGEGGCALITTPGVFIPDTIAGTTRAFTINITNQGTIAWIPGTPVILGSGSSCYLFKSITPGTIPPGATATINMEFNAPIGECCADLAFPNSGPCISTPLVINMCGTGLAMAVERQTDSKGFALDQNFPNPFANTTSFNFTTPKETEVSISLNDLSGNVIRTLIKGVVSGGKHLVSFDASNLPSGTYFCTLRSGSTWLTREFVLAK